MATFKNIAYQHTETIDAKSTGQQLVLNVGDVISYDIAEQVAKKVDKRTAIDNKLLGENIYIVAQSDDVTDRNGTPYKCYKLGDTVTLETGATRKVVVYPVEDINNVIGLE